MNELIKIEKRDGTDTVSARDLHKFLEVGRDFSSWIKQRIEKYGFVEDVDFAIFRGSPISGSGNRGASIEYSITIDMAKELSMVENNDKGREARRYFIEMERRAREIATPKIPQTYAEALRLAADQAEQLSIMAPKAELADKAIRDDQEHYSITKAGKHLGIRRSDMFAILRAKGMLTKDNLPTQKALDYEILQLRSNPDCNGRNRPQAIMTMANIHNFNKRYFK